MTDEVDPSKSGDGEALAIAQAIKQHGAVGDGWIAASDTAYYADQSSDVTGAPLNAFNHASTSGLDVTIDTGEAFIGGAWLARDTQTTVSLADNTAGQTVYVGWDASATESVIVGLDSAFAADDERLPIWTFDTDAGAVVASTDERTIGKQTELGAATLDADTEIARFLMTAASTSTHGTAGDATNELWRAGTGTSDLLMNVVADGRMNLAWNAYYDGTDWRFIVGSENAFRIAFGVGTTDLQFLTADGSAAAADDIISWDGFAVSEVGDLWATGPTQLYDRAAGEFLQARLGGPASSLTSYPLPAGDISDGSGSGLDADTVDGKEASELGSGRWTLLDSVTDTDRTTVFDHTFAPTTTYDEYMLDIRWEPNHGNNESEWMNVQLNQDGSSNYHVTYASDSAEVNTSQNDPWFTRVANVQDDQLGHARYVIHAPKSTLSTVPNRYPQLAPIDDVTGTGIQYLNGTYTVDTTEVTHIRVTSGNSPRYAAAEVELHGSNL